MIHAKILSFDPLTVELPKLDEKDELTTELTIQLPNLNITIQSVFGESMESLLGGKGPSVTSKLPGNALIINWKEGEEATQGDAIQFLIDNLSNFEAIHKKAQEIANNHGPLLKPLME